MTEAQSKEWLVVVYFRRGVWLVCLGAVMVREGGEKDRW